jgi:adenylate cyclase
MVMVMVMVMFGLLLLYDLLRTIAFDMQLGDQVQKEMTIMFADIRNFTSMSEKMTPQENFNFINSYLGVVGPIIRHHGGFIDKFIGDAIMALFPDDPSAAIQASQDMLRLLKEFNVSRVVPIQIGIGLHTGSTMLGTIGESERMDSMSEAMLGALGGGSWVLSYNQHKR